MDSIFIDIDYQQLYKHGQRIGGDVFLLDRQSRNNVITATLSDGLGSGVKANVLASLTSHMANKFSFSPMNLTHSAEIIMNTLPVDQEKGISYSTFTIARISYEENKSFINTSLVEYDSPASLRFSGSYPVIWDKEETALNREAAVKNEMVYSSSFSMHVGDRLIFFSDGVPMAGMVLGAASYEPSGKMNEAELQHALARAAVDRSVRPGETPAGGLKSGSMGWGEENVRDFIQKILENDPDISSRDLTHKIVTRALQYDNYQANDDITCAAVYVRKPRRTLVITGAPRNMASDRLLKERIEEFDGQVIVCGGTTAKIVARELGRKVRPDHEASGSLPPSSLIDGIDLVTEGMLTLSEVAKRLSRRVLLKEMPEDPAKRLIRILRNTDQVEFIVGTRINDETDDPVLAAKIGIRFPLIDQMTRALQDIYLKEVEVRYL